MALIKSHSNYVLKKRHQDVGDGTIFERDITTIGALNQFAVGQIPIYSSSNFIITINGLKSPTRSTRKSGWVANDNGYVWTPSDIEKTTSEDVTDNDTVVVLKQDYYDFRDFAYYGSLSELFRCSINHIIKSFVGELFGVKGRTYYTDPISGSTPFIDSDTACYLDNPFNIDMHTTNPIAVTDKLKWLANGGWQNYEFIRSDGVVEEFSSYTVTYVTTEQDPKVYCPGHKFAEITIGIRGVQNVPKIQAFHGDYDSAVYVMSTNSFEGVHIRPKEEFLKTFKNKLNAFERILMDDSTTPKYKATFSVIGEDDYGYTKTMETFIFPTTYGGFNIDPSSNGFEIYTTRLASIAAFYDDRFTDNLWRSMTHESIKNFDWTHSRDYLNGDALDEMIGGERMEKAIHLFAMEFDEIKAFIDGLMYVNRVTYDERSNMPDYFLTDSITLDGWDVKGIIPYTLSEKDDEGTEVTNYSESYQLASNGFLRFFSQDSTTEVAPYMSSNLKYPKGYFITYQNDGTAITRTITENTTDGTYTTDDCGNLVDRVKEFSNDSKAYTFSEVNNEFLRRLKINSNHIWRKKGTLDGIESILAMFALKSGRHGIFQDYDMDEYTSFTQRIEEKWDAVHGMYRIDWVNKTKNIVYDYRSETNGAVENTIDYVSYQGLPIAARYADTDESMGQYISCENNGPTNDEEKAYKYKTSSPTRTDNNVRRRFLYPYFSSTEEVDGHPYFQMNGGWFPKKISTAVSGMTSFAFDGEDRIASSEKKPIFSETYRDILCVETLGELLEIPMMSAHEGEIVEVTNVNENVAIVDGQVYPIKFENNGQDVILSYISLYVNDGYVSVGDIAVDDTISVYGKNGDVVNISVYDKSNGYEIKAYLLHGESGYSFIASGTYEANSTITSFSTFLDTETDYTNFFILRDIYGVGLIKASEDQQYGWERLTYDSAEYKRVNVPKNYFKGNNPHVGHNVYDNGHEYYKCFKQLFWYPLSQDLFDTRCYQDYLYTSESEISEYGFKGLVEDDFSVTDYDKYLIKDVKIHYFGNYKYLLNNQDSNYRIYTSSTNKANEYKNRYGNNVTKYALSSDAAMVGGSPYAPYSAVADDVTNQIVNNKILDLTFYLHNDWNTNDGQCEVKYLDSVVFNYLTQLVPSTTIGRIKYARRFYTKALNKNTVISFVMPKGTNSFVKSVSYRVNGGEVVTVNSISGTSVTASTPNLSNGDVVEWSIDGTSTSLGTTVTMNSDNTCYFKTNTQKSFEIGGNLDTLLTNMDGLYNQTEKYIFRGLFKDCTTLKDVSKLVMPDSTSFGCYDSMFSGCTQLFDSPKLQATSLAEECYQNMFNGCSNLRTITMLAETNGTNAFRDWVKNVPTYESQQFIHPLFYKSSKNTWIQNGTSGIPMFWTVINV